jgi:hypothetical protein
MADFKNNNIKFNQDIANQIPPSNLVNLLKLTNIIETVTTIPTKVPTKFYDQVKIYYDAATSPSTMRLYIYSNLDNNWRYITIDA